MKCVFLRYARLLICANFAVLIIVMKLKKIANLLKGD